MLEKTFDFPLDKSSHLLSVRALHGNPHSMRREAAGSTKSAEITGSI